MHEITAIWYIPNSVPLDIIQIDSERFVILVKHEDKENLKHTYKLYQFDINTLNQGDFCGSLVFSDAEEKLNSSEYCPCTITYSSSTERLYFLKLYDDRIEIVDFLTDKQSNLFKEGQKHVQKLPEIVKQANSIDGQLVNGNNGKESFMLISYGKYYNIDSQHKQGEDVKEVSWSNVEDSNGNVQFCKHNNEEFLMKWKLD